MLSRSNMHFILLHPLGVGEHVAVLPVCRLEKAYGDEKRASVLVLSVGSGGGGSRGKRWRGKGKKEGRAVGRIEG